MQLMHAHTSGISIGEGCLLHVCEKITYHMSDTREDAGVLVWGGGHEHFERGTCATTCYMTYLDFL